MADDFGFQIREDFYPFPTTYRLSDAILVEEIAGLEWHDFLTRLQAMFFGDGNGNGSNGTDYRALTGIVAIAIRRKNPAWHRNLVARAIEDIEIEELDMVFPKADDGEEDARPPESQAGSTAPEKSASSSESGSGSTSETPSPETSGTSESPTSLKGQSG